MKKRLEAQAFHRWQLGEFLTVERENAYVWRRLLSTLDLEEMGKRFRTIGIAGKSVRILAEAREMASCIVADSGKTQQTIELALLFIGVGPQQQARIPTRWINTGSPPIVSYAPYAAYVLTVEVFFQLALAASLISRARPSNRTDVAYLFYLPFCMLFYSCPLKPRPSNGGDGFVFVPRAGTSSLAADRRPTADDRRRELGSLPACVRRAAILT